jgi:hypothetical protein
MVCHTLPSRKGIGSILDFYWSRVKLPIWLLAFLLAITFVSTEPISDIYTSISFQWYKEFYKTMRFDPCNYILKILESFGTPTPNMGIPLGVWGFMPSHSLHSRDHVKWLLGVLSWPATLQPPCLGREPKAKVTTSNLCMFFFVWIIHRTINGSILRLCLGVFASSYPFQHDFWWDIWNLSCPNSIMFWPKGGCLIYSSTNCCNPSLGLVIDARGCKVAGQQKDLRFTSHAFESANSVRVPSLTFPSELPL